MSGTEKFWLGFFALFFSASAVLVLSITSYWKDHNEKAADMVKAGINPVAVMCALQDDYGNHPVCIVLAAKGDSE